jgi:hypothetical protein
VTDGHGLDVFDVYASGVGLSDYGGVASALEARAVVCPGCGFSGKDGVDFGEEGDGLSIGEVADAVEGGFANSSSGWRVKMPSREDMVASGVDWSLLMMCYIDC